MDFKYFCLKTDLLEDFDGELKDYESLTEANLGDLDVANVIKSGLDGMKSPDVKSIVGSLAVVAKLTGKKVRDIIKLFSNEGFKRIRGFIENDIIGSEEVQYMLKMYRDPDHYKGYKGLENFIIDMKEKNPKISDSLRKAVDKIFA